MSGGWRESADVLRPSCPVVAGVRHWLFAFAESVPEELLEFFLLRVRQRIHRIDDDRLTDFWAAGSLARSRSTRINDGNDVGERLPLSQCPVVRTYAEPGPRCFDRITLMLVKNQFACALSLVPSLILKIGWLPSVRRDLLTSCEIEPPDPKKGLRPQPRSGHCRPDDRRLEMVADAFVEGQQNSPNDS